MSVVPNVPARKNTIVLPSGLVKSYADTENEDPLHKINNECRQTQAKIFELKDLLDSLVLTGKGGSAFSGEVAEARVGELSEVKIKLAKADEKILMLESQMEFNLTAASRKDKALLIAQQEADKVAIMEARIRELEMKSPDGAKVSTMAAENESLRLRITELSPFEEENKKLRLRIGELERQLG